jgi:hypothetical protein
METAALVAHNPDDQRRVAMGERVVTELKGCLLRGEPGFYQSFLGFPETGIDKDMEIAKISSDPKFIAQVRAIDNTCARHETKLYAPLARLLNEIIGVTANVEYRPATSSQPVPVPKSISCAKHFFVDFHKYKSKDLTTHRRTDLAMVYGDPRNTSGGFSYSDVSCPIEIKRKSESASVVGEMADQIKALYAVQSNRNFVFSLTIQFPKFYVWRWDPSGAITSLDKDILLDFDIFVWLIRRLSSMTFAELGYDPAFRYRGDTLLADRQFTLTLVDKTRGTFRVVAEELLWCSNSLFGRATQCWKVRIMDNPAFPGYHVLKQSFVDADRTLTEDDVYTGIEPHVTDGVARRIAYDESNKVSSLRKGLGLDDEFDEKGKRSYTFEDRVCVRMLLSPVGRRLEELETLAELFGAIRDSVAGK